MKVYEIKEDVLRLLGNAPTHFQNLSQANPHYNIAKATLSGTLISSKKYWIRGISD